MTPTPERVEEAVANQRLARMRQVWQTSQPDDPETDAAYQRFRRRRAAGGGRGVEARERGIGWHFAMGMLVGFVALFGVRLVASGFSSGKQTAKGDGGSEPALVAHGAAPPPGSEAKPGGEKFGVAHLRAAFVQRGSSRTEIAGPTKLELGSGEVVSVTLGEAVREFAGPGVVEIVIAPEDVSGWSCEFTPLLEAPAAGTTTGAMQVGAVHETARPGNGKGSPREADSGWAEVARALGARDTGAASRALEKLSQSPSGKTRDAAKLAQAQLWLSQGEADRARPVLVELSRSGATEVVRARAAEALKVDAR